MEQEMQYYLSPNFRKIENGNNAYIYDSILGNGFVVNKDSLRVLELLNQERDISQLTLEYDVLNLESFLSKIKEKKFLIPKGKFPPIYRYSVPNEKVFSGALIQHLRLNVTEACNLDCTYCYEKETNIFTKRRTMRWQVAQRSIDEFFRLIGIHKHKKISIRFFGGEPLLNWPIVERSMNYIAAMDLPDVKISFIINTNGTLFNDDIARTIHEHKVHISLSVDGVGDHHDKFRKFKSGQGTFNIIDKNIDLLIKNKCNFGCAVVLSDQNYPHLKELVNYIMQKKEQTGYDFSVNFSPLCRTERKNLDTIEPEKKIEYLIDAIKYARENQIHSFGGLTHFPINKILYGVGGVYCGGMGMELSVNPNGEVYPCSGLDMKLGTIDDFNAILKSPEYLQLTKRRAGNLPKCKGCDIEGFCAGGCAADTLLTSGDIFGQCIDCEFQKGAFKALVREYLLDEIPA